MSPKARNLRVVGAVLILLGVLAFALQPGEPKAVCTSENGPTSGFVDAEQDCPISQESWNEIADYRSSPKPFRIAGLVLVVAGVGTLVAAGLSARRSNRTE